MRVLIVGAGWYGCYAAMLLEHNAIPFHIIDKNNDFFTGSSSMNQNRLHLGFHYPRSYHTREECQAGFKRFRELFPPFFSVPIPNVYAISKNSHLDQPTFCHIYKYEGIPFRVISPQDWTQLSHMTINPTSMDGALLSVDEHYIDFQKVQSYFRTRFEQARLPYDAQALEISEDACQVTYNGISYTHVLDCTYGQWRPFSFSDPLYYEVCCTFLYSECASHHAYPLGPTAFTVMDGSFFSLYPYDMDRRVYTLTHPRYTPLRQCVTSAEAMAYVDEIQGSASASATIQDTLQDTRRAMEKDVLDVFPDFRTYFQEAGYYLSIKAKFKGGCDDRSVRIYHQGIISSLIGGKITGIFALDSLVESIVTSTGAVFMPLNKMVEIKRSSNST